MFEINGVYANRKGKYTVLSLDGPRMQVRFEDGTHAELNVAIQERIWLNILAEQQVEAQKASQALSRGGANNRHYIKSVSLPAADELMFPGWQERVVMTSNPIQAKLITPGDRLIYYAIETDCFFAVATITGEAFKADPKDYFYPVVAQEATFFPIDVDVAVFTPEEGISRDSVELDEYPNLKRHLSHVETFFSISEDDFELLAELLTEVTESESDGISDEDYEEEEEED